MFKAILIKAILISIAFVLFGRPVMGTNVYSVPPQVKPVIKQILDTADQTYLFGQHERRQVAALGKSFDAALDNLANITQAAWADQAKRFEGEGIAPKLIIIAVDRKTYPAIYAELEEKYLHTVDNPMGRAPSSPPLQSVHLSETYRLAWEYLLLRPPSKSAAYHYELRVTKALRMIGNAASMITLMHSYRITTHKNVVLTRYVSQRQRLLLSTFGQIPKQEALNAIMQCVALSDMQRQKGKIIDTRWDPERYAYRLLTDQVNYGLGERWRKVIVEVPVQKVSPDKARLFNKVKQYWRKTPSTKRNTGK